MRYSYEFKRKCVEMYYRGEYPDTPEGISTDRFHNKVREWVRIEESCGPDALRHKNQNKEWTPDERYALVARVLAGESNKTVALSSGLQSITLIVVLFSSIIFALLLIYSSIPAIFSNIT